MNQARRDLMLWILKLPCVAWLLGKPRDVVAVPRSAKPAEGRWLTHYDENGNPFERGMLSENDELIHWIPVTEQLPPYGHCLTYNGFVDTTLYWDGGTFGTPGFGRKGVTHWAELPAGPTPVFTEKVVKPLMGESQCGDGIYGEPRLKKSYDKLLSLKRIEDGRFTQG